MRPKSHMSLLLEKVDEDCWKKISISTIESYLLEGCWHYEPCEFKHNYRLYIWKSNEWEAKFPDAYIPAIRVPIHQDLTGYKSCFIDIIKELEVAEQRLDIDILYDLLAKERKTKGVDNEDTSKQPSA